VRSDIGEKFIVVTCIEQSMKQYGWRKDMDGEKKWMDERNERNADRMTDELK